MTKKFLVLNGLILFVLCSVAFAEDRRTNLSSLVVMTLNAEFLWDGISPEEGGAEFPWKHSQTEAEEHMEDIATIIIQHNPDMVNLVEIENLSALETLNEQFLAGRGYQAYLIDGTDTATGQDVALLSRLDPQENIIERFEEKGTSGSVSKSVSKNYFARLQVGEENIGIIGLHFLAHPLREDRRLLREAQADAIRTLAIQLKAEGRSLIVLGDFNDFDGHEDSRDHIDSTPVTNVLRIIRGMKEDDPSDDLLNAASFLPKGQRFTAFWDANDNGQIDPPSELTAIDHILVSPHLAQHIETVQVSHLHDPRFVTDHFPVVVKLAFDEPLLPLPVKIRITRLLPNPAGSESETESATIGNLGNQSVDLAGWTLRDLTGNTWVLDSIGMLAAGEERELLRSNQPMAMNNNGDTIDLIDDGGTIIQTITYPPVNEGEFVIPAN